MNNSNEFSPLRRAIRAVLLADWYKKRANVVSDLDTLKDSRYVAPVMAKRFWITRDFLDSYVSSYWGYLSSREYNAIVGGITPEAEEVHYYELSEKVGEFLSLSSLWLTLRASKPRKIELSIDRIFFKRLENNPIDEVAHEFRDIIEVWYGQLLSQANETKWKVSIEKSSALDKLLSLLAEFSLEKQGFFGAYLCPTYLKMSMCLRHRVSGCG